MTLALRRSTATLPSSLVAALPEVADVQLHRNWPHQLGIEVIERTMVYQRINGDSYQWVDANGKIFHTIGERVDGIVADTAGDEQRMLADVATTVAALPPDVIAQTGQVSASTIDHIVVLLVDGRSIVWGNADNSAEKTAVLPALLAMSAGIAGAMSRFCQSA